MISKMRSKNWENRTESVSKEENSSQINKSSDTSDDSVESIDIIARKRVGCAYTRESVKNHRLSPILFDPVLLSHPITSEGVKKLRKVNVSVINPNKPINSGMFATLYEATLDSHREKVRIAVKRS